MPSDLNNSSSRGSEVVWQQALALGTQWWQHVEKIGGQCSLDQQQQQQDVISWLDLSAPAVGHLGLMQFAVDTSAGQKQTGSATASAAAASAGVGSSKAGALSPAAIMTNAHLLRLLLDHNQQQQHVLPLSLLLLPTRQWIPQSGCHQQQPPPQQSRKWQLTLT